MDTTIQSLSVILYASMMSNHLGIPIYSGEMKMSFMSLVATDALQIWHSLAIIVVNSIMHSATGVCEISYK